MRGTIIGAEMMSAEDIGGVRRDGIYAFLAVEMEPGTVPVGARIEIRIIGGNDERRDGVSERAGEAPAAAKDPA